MLLQYPFEPSKFFLVIYVTELPEKSDQRRLSSKGRRPFSCAPKGQTNRKVNKAPFAVGSAKTEQDLRAFFYGIEAAIVVVPHQVDERRGADLL